MPQLLAARVVPGQHCTLSRVSTRRISAEYLTSRGRLLRVSLAPGAKCMSGRQAQAARRLSVPAFWCTVSVAHSAHKIFEGSVRCSMHTTLNAPYSFNGSRMAMERGP